MSEKRKVSAEFHKQFVQKMEEEYEERIALFQKANKNLIEANKELNEKIQNEMHHRHKAEQEAKRATDELANYGEVVIAHKREAEEWERKYNELLGLKKKLFAYVEAQEKQIG